MKKTPDLIKKKTNIPVIETVLDRYTYIKKKNPKDFNKKYSNIYRDILVARSQLSQNSRSNLKTVPRPPSPHLSHKMSFAEFPLHKQGSQTLKSLSLGPARHDLLSSDIGQPELSTVRFLNAKLSHSNNDNVKIDDITLIHILSLFPSRGLERKP